MTKKNPKEHYTVSYFLRKLKSDKRFGRKYAAAMEQIEGMCYSQNPCRICWGKGYTTSLVADRNKVVRTLGRVCSCPRGESLKTLFTTY
jgi:hypothetical protein